MKKKDEEEVKKKMTSLGGTTMRVNSGSPE